MNQNSKPIMFPVAISILYIFKLSREETDFLQRFIIFSINSVGKKLHCVIAFFISVDSRRHDSQNLTFTGIVLL